MSKRNYVVETEIPETQPRQLGLYRMYGRRTGKYQKQKLVAQR